MRLTRRSLMATVWATGLVACSPGPKSAATAPANAPTFDPGPDATGLAEMIAKGSMSPAEAVNAAIKRAQAAQPQINFMVSDTFDAARARAATQLTGPFAGVPTLIKDLNDVIGAVTRKGSRATEGTPPATEESLYVSTLLGSGLICIGKSAAPENGYLPTTEPLAFGPTRNPWDPTRSTGGSSGGAAAAVASGVVPMAHGNDGGGSLRFPSANCGVFGLKPSRGRMVNEEAKPGPLDVGVQGCIARTVRDVAGALAVTERSGTSAIYPAIGLVNAPVSRKLKVGVLTKGFTGYDADQVVADAVHGAAKLMEGLGHSISETNWPTDSSFSDDFLAYWSLGAAQDIAAFAKQTGKKIDTTMVEPFSLQMAENAQKMKPEDIEAVQKRLLAAGAAYDEWIKGFDIVLSPVFASPPSPLGYLRGDVPFDQLRERLLQQAGYTLIHNISGAPAMSVPLGWSPEGLPIGVQACAANGEERLLLETALQLEAAQPWAGRKPPIWVG